MAQKNGLDRVQEVNQMGDPRGANINELNHVDPMEQTTWMKWIQSGGWNESNEFNHVNEMDQMNESHDANISGLMDQITWIKCIKWIDSHESNEFNHVDELIHMDQMNSIMRMRWMNGMNLI